MSGKKCKVNASTEYGELENLIQSMSAPLVRYGKRIEFFTLCKMYAETTYRRDLWKMYNANCTETETIEYIAKRAVREAEYMASKAHLELFIKALDEMLYKMDSLYLI